MGLLPSFIEFPAPGLRFSIEIRPPEDLGQPAGEVDNLFTIRDGVQSVTIAARGSSLELYAPKRGTALHVLALQGICKQFARQILPGYLSAVAREVGVDNYSTRIGDQRRRWGSCSLRDSARPKICLNWRALLLPMPLLRQLCLHEICHILEMSHSRKFHALLAAHNPDERRSERELGLAWRDLPPWAVHYSHLIPGRTIR